jgi:hypothetical protein
MLRKTPDEAQCPAAEYVPAPLYFFAEGLSRGPPDRAWRFPQPGKTPSVAASPGDRA